MVRNVLLAIACGLAVLLSGAPLLATDGLAPSSGPADQTPKDKDRDKVERPINSLKDLMQRMQKRSSDALLAFRGSDTAAALEAVKKVEGYAAQMEKWIPDTVSKEDAKKKRFLENVTALRKGYEETLKLLDPPDLKKAAVEYAKASRSCTTCHNEFRPKK